MLPGHEGIWYLLVLQLSVAQALLDCDVETISQAPSRPKVPKMQEPTPEELHFEILGCALRLPGGGVDSPPPGTFWSMLLEDDQDRENDRDSLVLYGSNIFEP